jgi:hypothetical protein
LISCKFLDIDDDFLNIDNDDANKIQEDINIKQKIEINRYNIEILQQRYGWLRNEIMMNIDHRYKLVQFLLALIPITYTVIVVAKLYLVSILASIVVLIIAILFHSENRSIIDKSDYLIKLENFIDFEFKLPISGWETYARSPEMEKMRATKTLNFTFLILFIFAYSFYNMIFCFYIYNGDLNINLFLSQFYNINIIKLFALLEIPILILSISALFEVYGYFKKH